MFTLFRQPGMTDAVSARDAGWVAKDLAALKTLLDPDRSSSEEPDHGKLGERPRIDYVEMGVADIKRSKVFYGNAFAGRSPTMAPLIENFPTDG